MTDDSDLRGELEAARATVASQAMQIHRLQQDAERGSGLDALQQLLQLSDIVGVTIGQSPYRALLDGIIVAARRLFDAGAASLLLLDSATDELVFEAASGGGEVLGLRIPSHQGIAGWVVMSGEPIASSDVRRDPRWARDFAESTGYIPNSIMAVPLLVGDEVEGVLEVLDKHNAGSFGLNDMELLGLFAQPAAIAVEQARTVTNIGRVLVSELGKLAAEGGATVLAGAAQQALQNGATTPDQVLELARLVHHIGRRGERARDLTMEILNSVSRYSG
jgi:signal transduction protein with GAF and PtsI domain